MNNKHAIIGCGRVAPNHVYACQNYKKKVKYCFDIENDKARIFKDKYGIELCADSYQQILDDNEISSVSICTDHASHYPLALEAIKSGKSVIIEKPICLKVEEADELIKEAKKHKVVLSAVSQHRYNPLINRIKKYVDEGAFGNITMINAFLNCSKDKEYYTTSSWRGTIEKEGGSTLINQGIHTLDLVVWMKGQPESTKSFGTTTIFKGVIETEDNFAGVMRFADDGLAVISSTNTSVDQWDSKIELIGTKGKITFSTGFPAKILDFQHKDDAQGERILADLKSLKETDDLPPTMNYYGTSHREQLEDFFLVVEGKREELKMDPIEARNTLAVVCDLYKYN